MMLLSRQSNGCEQTCPSRTSVADDQEQRTFEVIKLRIAFLQHITTLSGAAILIILALVARAETVKQVKLLAGTVPLYVLAALISVGGIVLLIGPPKIMRLERATTGGFTTVLAGSAFAGAIFLTAYYAAGGTPRLLQ